MLGVSLGPVNSVVHLSEALSGSDLPSRRAHWLLRASFVLFGRRVGGAGWKRWREGFAGERRRDCQLCSASSSKVGSCWSAQPERLFQWERRAARRLRFAPLRTLTSSRCGKKAGELRSHAGSTLKCPPTFSLQQQKKKKGRKKRRSPKLYARSHVVPLFEQQRRRTGDGEDLLRVSGGRISSAFIQVCLRAHVMLWLERTWTVEISSD